MTLTAMEVDGRIETFTGMKFDILDPNPEHIHIIDIAHALSQLCRYNGHTMAYYSVAQHSVIVSNLAKPEDALTALMHDAAEAYIGDMAYPIKHMFPLFKEIEDNIQTVIAAKFGFQHPMPQYLKEIDRNISGNEAESLMSSRGDWWNGGEGYPKVPGLHIKSFLPEEAREMFLRRFEELKQGGYVGN